MTAPAVLTVEQLEELDSKPLVRWDVVDKSRALETARAYHRLGLGRADAGKLVAAARDLAKMVIENGYESALRRAAERILYLTKERDVTKLDAATLRRRSNLLAAADACNDSLIGRTTAAQLRRYAESLAKQSPTRKPRGARKR